MVMPTAKHNGHHGQVHLPSHAYLSNYGTLVREIMANGENGEKNGDRHARRWSASSAATRRSCGAASPPSWRCRRLRRERDPVLLIDTDARRRRVTKRFHINGSPGWREVLSGKADTESCVHRQEVGNLASCRRARRTGTSHEPAVRPTPRVRRAARRKSSRTTVGRGRSAAGTRHGSGAGGRGVARRDGSGRGGGTHPDSIGTAGQGHAGARRRSRDRSRPRQSTRTHSALVVSASVTERQAESAHGSATLNGRVVLRTAKVLVHQAIEFDGQSDGANSVGPNGEDRSAQDELRQTKAGQCARSDARPSRQARGQNEDESPT